DLTDHERARRATVCEREGRRADADDDRRIATREVGRSLLCAKRCHSDRRRLHVCLRRFVNRDGRAYAEVARKSAGSGRTRSRRTSYRLRPAIRREREDEVRADWYAEVGDLAHLHMSWCCGRRTRREIAHAIVVLMASLARTLVAEVGPGPLDRHVDLNEVLPIAAVANQDLVVFRRGGCDGRVPSSA